MMNLKVEMPNFKLEMQNSDARRVEIVLQMISTALTGYIVELKNDNGETLPTELLEKVEAARPVKSKRNHVPAVNGMKTFPSGHTQYQCGYTCRSGHVGVRFIDKGTESTTCHVCGEELLIYPATEEKTFDGVPLPDSYNNYYHAR